MKKGFIEDYERIGEFLLKTGIIGDWDIEDENPSYDWAKIILMLDTNNPQTLEIVFNKENGYIMNITYSNTLDLLDK